MDETPAPREDWAEHERTYKGFVKGVIVFVAHAFIVLLILAWVFSDSFNTPPITG
jgi:hypothetical protein